MCGCCGYPFGGFANLHLESPGTSYGPRCTGMLDGGSKVGRCAKEARQERIGWGVVLVPFAGYGLEKGKYDGLEGERGWIGDDECLYLSSKEGRINAV